MERNNSTSAWRSDEINPSFFASTDAKEPKTEEQPADQRPNYAADCPVNFDVAKSMGLSNFVKVGNKYFPKTESTNQC